MIEADRAALARAVEPRERAIEATKLLDGTKILIGEKDVGRRFQMTRASLEDVVAARRALDDRPGEAEALGLLSDVLAGLGEHERSAERGKSCASILSDLSSERPSFTATLAARLQNVGVALANAGRREEALARTQEALTAYLAVPSPSVAVRADHAASLTNMDLWLTQLNRPSEGLERARAALAIYRELAQRDAGFRPRAAELGQSVADRLFGQDRRGEAADEMMRVVADLEALAGQNATAALAIALHTYASRLESVNRREDAVSALERSIAAFSKLVERGEELRAPVECLKVAERWLASIGRTDLAIAAAEALMKALRHGDTSAEGPARTALADVVLELARLYDARGRAEEACARSREAISLLTEIAVHAPERLGSLASAYLIAAAREQLAPRAVEAAAKAESLYLELVKADPTLRLQLGFVLHVRAVRLAEERTRRPEAIAIAIRAVGAYRSLPAHPVQLVQLLRSLAFWLKESGETIQAIERAKEAIQTWSELSETGRSSMREEVAATHRDLGGWLCSLKRGPETREGIQHAEDAVEICRQLARDNAVVGKAALVDAITRLGILLGRHGGTREALDRAVDLSQEALDVQSTLNASAEASGVLYNNRAYRLAQAGRADEGLPLITKAIELEMARSKDRGPYFASLQSTLAYVKLKLTKPSPQEALTAAREALRLRELARTTELDPDGVTEEFAIYVECARAAGEPEAVIAQTLARVEASLAPTGTFEPRGAP